MLGAVVYADIGRYWRLYTANPSMVGHHSRDIWAPCRDTFKRFFNADAIRLHGHCTDVAIPATISSLIKYMYMSIVRMSAHSED